MNITKLLSASIVSIVAIFLSGCQSTPPLNFSVPNVGVTKHKIDAEVKSMTVTVARPDEKTGVIPAAISVANVPQLWQTALIEALNKMAIFQDDSPNKVNLSVKILNLDPPSFGASMTTSAAARYEISDRKTGSIIYTQDIASTGTTPFDYAFVGETRAQESINRAVQNNITHFLKALDSVDIKKPMFPQSTGSTK